jgi:hypothetical protein
LPRAGCRREIKLKPNETKKLINQGFSVAIYTQTTDVEIEINGLMTYDRKVVKMNESRIKKANQEVCNSLSK